MKKIFLTRLFLGAGIFALLAGTQGCETLGAQRAREQNAKSREDMLILREDMRKLSGRVEAVEFELERFQNNRDSDISAIEIRLDEVESAVARVDTARQKDKQALIDTLSAKIAEIMSKSAKSSRKSRKRYSDTGYEHVVAPGESLSLIASGYGVTVRAIMDNNDIKDENKIRVGQTLFIPE